MSKKKKFILFIMLFLVLIIIASLLINTVIFLQSPYLTRRQYSGSVGSFKNMKDLQSNFSLYMIKINLPDVYNDKEFEHEEFYSYYYSYYCKYNPFNMTFRRKSLRRHFIYKLIYSDNENYDKNNDLNYYCNNVEAFANDIKNKSYNKPHFNYKTVSNPCADDCDIIPKNPLEPHIHIYYQIEAEVLYLNDRYIITVYSTDSNYDAELLNSEFDRIVASLD